MKESEPMLETRLYRCGWIFLLILCVWKIAKNGAVSAFCPVRWNASVCILYADGLFLPGMRRNPKSSGIAFRENFRECGGFSDDILCSSRICLVYDQPDDRPHQRTPASHRHEIP